MHLKSFKATVNIDNKPMTITVTLRDDYCNPKPAPMIVIWHDSNNYVPDEMSVEYGS